MASVHGGGLRIVRDLPEDGRSEAAAGFSIYDLTRCLGHIDNKSIAYDGDRTIYSLSRPLKDYFSSPLGLAAGDTPPRACLYDTLTKTADPPRREALVSLGRNMIASSAAADTAIPAAYTYLGQFIAHDVSKMDQTDPRSCAKNWRTAALDLDSVFWCDPGAPQRRMPPGTFSIGGVAVGPTARKDPVRYDDLPRQNDGKADIPDERNDHNVAVAQVHVLVSKFHQTVTQLFPKKTTAEQRAITLRHFHSVVLHDYLRRIIDPDVYRDVLERGRAVIRPDLIDQSFLLPIEFAAACFRFGHSMVRPSYPHWRRDSVADTDDTGANVDQLAANTWPGGHLGPGNRLKDDWRTRWPNLVDMGADEARDPHVASAIDTALASSLYLIPPWMVSGDTSLPDLSSRDRINLAMRTLVRGHTLGLPSGEELARFVIPKLDASRPRLQLMDRGEIKKACSYQIARFLDETSQGRELAGRTPLWLYVLCEANHHHRGQRLGPLASRIVMETLHAAIQAVPGSIIDQRQRVTFTPEKKLHRRAGSTYDLRDMIDCVANSWRAKSLPT